ncbi:MAG: O-antigen ligase family protein [Clostridia bacterium]|nr:O-antigen ligase family protein [Clostridia bacterium]
MKRDALGEEAIASLPAVLLFSVFPLSFHSYSGVTYYKYQVMLLCAAVCLVCLLFSPGRVRRHLRSALPALALALVYFGWVTLSAFLGSYADTLQAGKRVTLYGAVRYEGLISQLSYLAFFLTFTLLRPKRESVLTSAATGLTVYVALVLLQYLGINVLSLFPDGRSVQTNYEFQGPIGNIDLVSGYLSLVVPLLLLSWVQTQGPAWMVGSALLGVLLECMMEVQSGLLAMLLLGIGILCLGHVRPALRSRACVALGGMLGCACVRKLVKLPWLEGGALGWTFRPSALLYLLGALLLLVAAAWLRRNPGHAVKGRIVLALLAALLLLFLLILYLTPLGGEGSGLYEAHELLHGRGKDAFGSWRIGVWRLTLQMSGKHLLLGTGPDTFYYAFADYLAQTGSYIGETFDNPHNVYLAILLHSGLPALIAYLALVALCALRGFRRRDAFSLAVAGSVLVYSFQAFFSFSLCIVSPMFYAMLGCGDGEEREVDIR